MIPAITSQTVDEGTIILSPTLSSKERERTNPCIAITQGQETHHRALTAGTGRKH